MSCQFRGVSGERWGLWAFIFGEGERGEEVLGRRSSLNLGVVALSMEMESVQDKFPNFSFDFFASAS